MPSQLLRQSSFSGGEISPEFYGRTDSPVYGSSVRTCLNFFPRPHGALYSRPGTTYVAPTKASGQAILRPFVFADGQTFVLEFGAGYVRFYANGGQVLSGGVPYEVATPYTVADLSRLRFAQAADTITIVHPSYQPRELQRLSNTNWQLVTVNFTPQSWFAGTPTIALNKQAFGSLPGWSFLFAGYPAGTVVQYQPGGAGAYHAYRNTVAGNTNAPDGGGWTDLAWNSGTTYARGEYVWDNGLPFMSLNDNNKGNTTNTTAWWALATDSTHLAKSWRWQITQLWRDSLGVVRETQPTSVYNEATTTAVYSDRPATLTWAAPGASGFSFKMVGYNIYRGRNGVFGWVGAADAGATSFVDEGAEPDYTQQPPASTNPFAVADGANSATTNSWPGLVAYHEGRRIFARTDAKPQDIWGSAVSDIARFDIYSPSKDSDSYNWKLASQRLEEIRELVPLRALALFTGAAEWTMTGSTNGPIAGTSVKATRHSGHGCAYLQPLVNNNTILFVTAKGCYVRDFIYDWRADTYDGSDLTVHARHLFDAHSVVDWAFAEVPNTVAWLVRDDGALLSLTYDRGAQVVAWAQHSIAGGVVESVCSVPEGSEDAVYLIVRRTIGGATVRYVERLASRYVADVALGVFLDAAVTYNGAPTTILSGLGHLEGQAVSVLADGSESANAYTVTGGQIDVSGEFPDGVSKAVVGLAYNCDLELHDIAASSAKTNVKAVLRASLEVVASRAVLAGETFDKLSEADLRSVADAYGTPGLKTGIVSATVQSSWNQGGRAVFRHRSPLPLTVIAAIREVEVAGRGA